MVEQQRKTLPRSGHRLASFLFANRFNDSSTMIKRSVS